jgi:hypothetical protein
MDSLRFVELEPQLFLLIRNLSERAGRNSSDAFENPGEVALI